MISLRCSKLAIYIIAIMFMFRFFRNSRHLEQHNMLGALPLDKWYETCFAGVLAKPALVRVWDKICGGSRKIVVFVCVVMLNVMGRRIAMHKELMPVLELIGTVSLVIYRLYRLHFFYSIILHLQYNTHSFEKTTKLPIT